MSIDEQPMNVYWSGKRTETSNNFKTNYKGSVAIRNNLPNSGNKIGDMYNVTESGENFIWNGSSWDNLSGDTLKTLNWQKSAKAGAVTIYPVSETMLYPTVEFAFTETDPAEGDKSSDNPSTITGVNSVKVTRCGKNLIPIQSTGATTIYGVTFTVNKDGSIAVKGTASAVCYFDVWEYFNAIKPGVSYSLSGCPSGGNAGTFGLRLEGNFVGAGTQFDYSSGVSFTADKNLASGKIRIRVGNGITIDKVFHPQLELSSTVTSFESYNGADYTVDLGNTYYGGSIDLSTGLMTVTHVMVEPDSLSFDISAHPANTANFQYTDTFGRTVTTDGNTLTITGETGGKIVYNLAVPEIVNLSPLQIYSLSQADLYTSRLNTVYSNQASVQIGYAKSPVRSEYELIQAIAAIEGSE